jgi:hypothetical protein
VRCDLGALRHSRRVTCHLATNPYRCQNVVRAGNHDLLNRLILALQEWVLVAGSDHRKEADALLLQCGEVIAGWGQAISDRLDVIDVGSPQDDVAYPILLHDLPTRVRLVDWPAVYKAPLWAELRPSRLEATVIDPGMVPEV